MIRSSILAFLLAFTLTPAIGQTCSQGTSGTAPIATGSWAAPTAYTDGTTIPSTVTITYNLYQGSSATTLTKAVSGITSLTDTVNTGLADGQTYYFAVTAVANGVEGAKSNVGCKTFPAGTPGVVTLTIAMLMDAPPDHRL